MTLKETLEASRGPLKGLYLQLLDHPQLLQKLSDLGSFLRFEGILPHETKKFIILSVAHKLSFQPVWDTHIQDAHLPPHIISQIQSGQPFSTQPYHSLEQIVDASLKGGKIYRNNLKNREFDKEAPQNDYPEQATIAERQGASEDNHSEAKPTMSKTDSSDYFGIKSSCLEKQELQEAVILVGFYALLIRSSRTLLGE